MRSPNPMATLLCIIIATTATPAPAQTAAFREYGAPPSETLQLPIITHGDNISYVSLLDLVQSIGGAATLTPNRMRIDLNSTTAWVGLNDNRVNALSIFTLTHDIIANDTGVFIAVNDCQNFFKRSFRLNLGVNVLKHIDTAPRPDQPLDTQSPLESLQGIPGATQTTQPLTNPPQRTRAIRTILIEAGHGGFENGVEGPSGTVEKDITLSIAQLVNDILANENDTTVKLLRDRDADFTIEQRSVIAQSARADLLISLHIGGSFSPDTHGIAAFYPEQGSQHAAKGLSLRWHASNIATASRSAAETILTTLETELKLNSRGIHPIHNPLFSTINGPAILIELGCLTNPTEEAKLISPDYQEQLASALANGIRKITSQTQQPQPITELNNDSLIQRESNQ